jgi:hypothetical protein
MCGLQEVELRVSLLPLSESLQEFLSITCNELGSEFNDVCVDIS